MVVGEHFVYLTIQTMMLYLQDIVLFVLEIILSFNKLGVAYAILIPATTEGGLDGLRGFDS